jgi:hypothetical protein
MKMVEFSVDSLSRAALNYAHKIFGGGGKETKASIKGNNKDDLQNKTRPFAFFLDMTGRFSSQNRAVATVSFDAAKVKSVEIVKKKLLGKDERFKASKSTSWGEGKSSWKSAEFDALPVDIFDKIDWPPNYKLHFLRVEYQNGAILNVTLKIRVIPKPVSEK